MAIQYFKTLGVFCSFFPFSISIGISNNENSKYGAEYKIKRGSFVERRGRNKEHFTKIQTDTLTHENKQLNSLQGLPQQATDKTSLPLDQVSPHGGALTSI